MLRMAADVYLPFPNYTHHEHCYFLLSSLSETVSPLLLNLLGFSVLQPFCFSKNKLTRYANLSIFSFAPKHTDVLKQKQLFTNAIIMFKYSKSFCE